MNSVKKILFENVFIKVLALVLAIFTYLYVHREDIGEKIIMKVPVRVKGLPVNGEWRVVSLSHHLADLRLIGPRQKVELRNRDNVYIELDLDGLDFSGKEGNFKEKINITEEVVKGLDYDLKLDFGDKKSLEIEAHLARFATKQLSVDLNIRGKPAPGYRILWKNYTPTKVNVTGPANIIKYLNVIKSREIDIMGEDKNIEQEIGLDVAWLKAEALKKYPGEEEEVKFECDSRVQVSIVIRPLPSERVLKRIPIYIMQTSEKIWDVKTDPVTIDVTVTGDVDELNKLNRSVIKAYIDAQDLPAGPGKGITMAVKFFFIGKWESLRVKGNVSVKTDISLVRKP